MQIPLLRFRAQFEVLKDVSLGTLEDVFPFDDRGIRSVPTRHDQSRDRATLNIFQEPGALFGPGDVFEAECVPLAPEYWHDRLNRGYQFFVADPINDVLHGTVVEVMEDL